MPAELDEVVGAVSPTTGDMIGGMSRRFAELDACETRMGLLTLRRRVEPGLKVELYEVKLDDEFLMSSLFTVAERELAHLGLAAVVAAGDCDGLDVLVGGLGLGYTAAAALSDDRVRSVIVVDALEPVIRWHVDGLLPDVALTADPRTRLVHDDFFALMRSAPPASAAQPDGFHAILLDVDHSPRHLLDPSHADLYTASGLARLRQHLLPGGVFALWSDDPPDSDLLESLAATFVSRDAHVITFPNPLTRGESTATVYVARSPG